MSDSVAMMSQWMVVIVDGNEHLFGFADKHPRTGGLSWTLSTPIVEMDRETRQAVTLSGRRYRLGTHITSGDLDEEGAVAMQILVEGVDRSQLEPCDPEWLVACKWARHVQVPPPPRSDCKSVKAFLQRYAKCYRRRRQNSSDN